MTTPDATWEKLGRFLAGESSADEAAEVRRWLADHPREADAIRALHAASGDVRTSLRVDVEAALRTVKGRRTRRTGIGSVTRFGDFTRRVEVLAAAAAILLVAGVFGVRRIQQMGQPAAPEVAYATGVGQRDSVQLDDGSMVLLGPATRIVVRGRSVVLTGEAYFRVAHDEARPFTVRAGASVIRDIGTEFSVHGDSALEEVRVVVSEGAVALRRGQDSVLLERGDVGVAQSGRVEARRGVATADDLAWTRGRLVFRDASMGVVAADLRRWYGVQLRVTDSLLARRHFTGSFAAESASEVADALALALGALAERRADTVYIRPIAPAK